MTVTGERVTTPEAGFRPTWERHRAAYARCGPLLGPGRVLDLGCGVGHSYGLLAPRETVGVDIEAGALEGQDRETVRADMRALPFPDSSFESVLAVQSLEHVPDPERVMSEAARVLGPHGLAVWVTPNRLTFARADEIIDPYHYIEFDPEELARLASGFFAEVEVMGIFGSERHREFVAAEHRQLDRLLRRDPLRLRRAVPRRMRQLLYDAALTRARREPDPRAEAITVDDFELRAGDASGAFDLVAVCRRPRP